MVDKADRLIGQGVGDDKMNVKINNFTLLFSKRILERGYDYYLNGAVVNIYKTSDEIEADVLGSELYHVEILLNNERIYSMECDCPYAEDGENCKHMAALLYAVNDLSVSSVNGSADLKAAVNAMSEQSLREFVINLAESNRAIRERIIRLSGAKAQNEKMWQKDIVKIIDKYDVYDPSDEYCDEYEYEYEYGEAPYDCPFEIIEYLDTKLAALLKKGDFSTAARLTYTVFKTTSEYSTYDEITGDVAERCIRVWDEIIKASDAETEEMIFDMLYGFLLYQSEALEMSDAENVIASIDFGREYCEKYLSWIDENLTDFRIHNRLRMMAKLSAGTEDEISFLESNIHFDSVYRMLLERYESCDTGKAAELVKQHRDSCEMNYAAVEDTKKLISLAEKLNDSELFLEELTRLVFRYNCKDRYYISQLKKAMSPDEWYSIYMQLLNSASNQSERFDLLAFEGLYDMILMEMRGDVSLYEFIKHEKDLRKRYPEQTLEVYADLLKKAMYRASDRSAYRNVIFHLKQIKKYENGDETVRGLVELWLSEHKKRTAMKEELQKAGYVK